MSWQHELDELRRREAFADELGGPDKVKRQKDGGRYTVRERVMSMADDGTFHESGKIAGTAEYDENNELSKLVWFFDAPFADTSIIPTYALNNEAKKYTTVALSGDGADEILAG